MKRQGGSAILLLAFLLLISFFLECRYGAVKISLTEIKNALPHLFSDVSDLSLNERIFLQIRLPRAVLCLVTGMTLAAGGVLLQGLFRNPLLDPGLLGTSGGAAFGASLYIVLAGSMPLFIRNFGLPMFACMGAFLSTAAVMLFSFSHKTGRRSPGSLLLTGVAISALFISGVGFLSYIARDPQARSITFWTLGTLSGATWFSATVTSITSIICIFLSMRRTKALNAMMLGEGEAAYLGVNARRLTWELMILNTIMVAVTTSFVGVISFIGLVVPHLVRMIFGSEHGKLLKTTLFGGGIILLLGDLAARLLLQPAELPIGIVTSLIGVPVFLYLIRSGKYLF